MAADSTARVQQVRICNCCTIFQIAIICCHYAILAYGVALAVAIWWIVDSEGQIPPSGYILTVCYFVILLATLFLLFSIACQRKCFVLLSWLVLMGFLLLPECGLTMYSCVWILGTNSQKGLGFLVFYVVRGVLNIACLICIHALYRTWKTEKRAMRQRVANLYAQNMNAGGIIPQCFGARPLSRVAPVDFDHPRPSSMPPPPTPLFLAQPLMEGFRDAQQRSVFQPEHESFDDVDQHNINLSRQSAEIARQRHRARGDIDNESPRSSGISGSDSAIGSSSQPTSSTQILKEATDRPQRQPAAPTRDDAWLHAGGRVSVLRNGGEMPVFMRPDGRYVMSPEVPAEALIRQPHMPYFIPVSAGGGPPMFPLVPMHHPVGIGKKHWRDNTGRKHVSPVLMMHPAPLAFSPLPVAMPRSPVEPGFENFLLRRRSEADLLSYRPKALHNNERAAAAAAESGVQRVSSATSLRHNSSSTTADDRAFATTVKAAFPETPSSHRRERRISPRRDSQATNPMTEEGNRDYGEYYFNDSHTVRTIF